MFPSDASYINLGTGLNGIADYTLLPETIYGVTIVLSYAQVDKLIKFAQKNMELGRTTISSPPDSKNSNNIITFPGAKIKFNFLGG